jgi:hypothetical protein
VLTNRPGARLDGMAGQGLRSQPEAAWGSLHQATPGASLLDASTGEHSRGSSTRASSASPSTSRHRIGEARRRQIPREETTQIYSERRQLTNPFDGDGIGRGGEYLAQGGDGGDHRSWPEKPGGGGDAVSLVSSRGERGARGGWAGLVDRPIPEPGQLN